MSGVECMVDDCAQEMECMGCDICKEHCECGCNTPGCDDGIEHYRCNMCDTHCCCSSRTENLSARVDTTYGASQNTVIVSEAGNTGHTCEKSCPKVTLRRTESEVDIVMMVGSVGWKVRTTADLRYKMTYERSSCRHKSKAVSYNLCITVQFARLVRQGLVGIVPIGSKSSDEITKLRKEGVAPLVLDCVVPGGTRESESLAEKGDAIHAGMMKMKATLYPASREAGAERNTDQGTVSVRRQYTVMAERRDLGNVEEEGYDKMSSLLLSRQSARSNNGIKERGLKCFAFLVKTEKASCMVFIPKTDVVRTGWSYLAVDKEYIAVKELIGSVEGIVVGSGPGAALCVGTYSRNSGGENAIIIKKKYVEEKSSRREEFCYVGEAYRYESCSTRKALVHIGKCLRMDSFDRLGRLRVDRLSDMSRLELGGMLHTMQAYMSINRKKGTGCYMQHVLEGENGEGIPLPPVELSSIEGWILSRGESRKIHCLVRGRTMHTCQRGGTTKVRHLCETSLTECTGRGKNETPSSNELVGEDSGKKKSGSASVRGAGGIHTRTSTHETDERT